jgi:hypothetical protein
MTQTPEQINQENYEYRELLIKLNIEEDMKAIREPLDFLMYMLRGLAIISHDLDGNDDYVEFDWDDDGAKLDYLLDQLTLYKKMHRTNKKSYMKGSSMREKIEQHRNANANPSAESIINYIRTKPNAS